MHGLRAQAVGASAVNQLRAKGIEVVKVSPGSEIQGLIEPGTAMIEFALGPDRSFIFLVKAELMRI